MIETTERTLARSGSTLHYWLSGPEGRPLVALTHGATMDHRMFEAQVAALAGEYRVLTWDVRGHGRSQPIGADFSMGACADDLLALIQAAGYAQAALVGQSMGGYIAQELMFRRPECALVFVSIGSTSITMPYPLGDRLALALTGPTLRVMPYGYFKRLTARTVAITPAVQAYAYEALSQVSQRDMVTIMSAVTACLHAEPGYTLPVPALLTHGDDDTTGRIKGYAPRWAAQVPGSVSVVIPDAGHNAYQDNPAFFNRLLLEFLHQHVPV